MTYNMSALENTTGMEVFTGLNEASGGIVGVGLVVALGLIMFLTFRQANDDLQSATYSAIFMGLLSAMLAWQDMMNPYVASLIAALALVLMFLNYQKGASA